MVMHTHMYTEKEPNCIIAGCHVIQGFLLGEKQYQASEEEVSEATDADHCSIAIWYKSDEVLYIVQVYVLGT